LYAVDPNGTEKWQFKTNAPIISSPTIDSDGTIYIGSHDGYLYALDPNGTEKWQFKAGLFVLSSPVISSDGTIYFGGQETLDLAALYAVLDSQEPVCVSGMQLCTSANQKCTSASQKNLPCEAGEPHKQCTAGGPDCYASTPKDPICTNARQNPPSHRKPTSTKPTVKRVKK
jgi:hypothetical protein